MKLIPKGTIKQVYFSRENWVLARLNDDEIDLMNYLRENYSQTSEGHYVTDDQYVMFDEIVGKLAKITGKEQHEYVIAKVYDSNDFFIFDKSAGRVVARLLTDGKIP